MQPISATKIQTYTLKAQGPSEPADFPLVHVYDDVFTNSKTIRVEAQSALREDGRPGDHCPTPGLVMLPSVDWGQGGYHVPGNLDVMASSTSFVAKRGDEVQESYTKNPDGTEVFTWYDMKGSSAQQEVRATFNTNGTITAEYASPKFA